MKLIYIRHAQTKANLSGDMVKDYANADILPVDRKEWFEKTGFKCHNAKIFCSPAKRCRQTVRALFGDTPYMVLPNLHEFDCGGLGDKKFWEISEEEFNQLVPLKKEEMLERIENALIDIMANSDDAEEAIVVGHGLYGRTLFDYFNKKKDTPYELLNSKHFQFSNLDVMVIEHAKVQEVKRYKEPYKRG